MTRHLRTVAVANLKVGRGRAAIRGLAALVRDTDADAVLLQEAKNYLPAIRARFGATWRVYGGPGFVEASNCAVMVRRSIRRGKRGAVRNRTPWYYRGKGRNVKHPGRVWRWARVDGVFLMSVHKATNALSLNKDAGREEADRLAEWFGDHAGPMIAAGDWNNTADDRRPNGPAEIARLAKAQVVVPPGARIDYALVRGVDVTAKSGKSYGSDHESFTTHIKRP